MRQGVGFKPAEMKTRRRSGICLLVLLFLSASSAAGVLLVVPSIPAAHAAQPIPSGEYFGNTFNSTQTGAITLTNTTQVVDVRFTAGYGGAAIPRIHVNLDYYLPGYEYDLAIGIQTDSSGSPSGHFVGAFVWNVSSGFCNGCGGWVYPGFASKAGPLNHTISLAVGDVYHIVAKYLNGTFANYPPLCYGADCLVFGYLGGTNFQQSSLDERYDPSQALLFCAKMDSCTVIPDANPLYAVALNGSTLWQGQVEAGGGDVGIGAPKGGTGLASYQGERFWMLWNTVTVNHVQVLLSKVGSPTGRLNLLIWNFTASSASNILGATEPSLELNRTVIWDLSAMPDVVDQAFNFSLGQGFTLQTGHLYQMSFVIYGNITAVGGSNRVGIATTGTNGVPNDLSWGGVMGSATGPCQQYQGGCAAFSYAGGSGNTAADASPANDLIFIMRIVSSTVVQPISIQLGNSAPTVNVTVVGCYGTPSTFPSDGDTHLMRVTPSCDFTLSFSNAGATRNGFSLSESFSSTWTETSCSTGECQSIALNAFLQLQNTYSAIPAETGGWDADLAIAVTGTQLGVPGQSGCSISTSDNGESAACTAWFDYRTQVDVANPVAVSSTERWIASGESDFTQATGGNLDKVSFIDQFQVSFMTSPSGTGRANPSGSSVWEAYGPVPISATPNGGYLFEDWSTNTEAITLASAENAGTTATVHGSGTITATFTAPVTQPITLTLVEQQGAPANFVVSGCYVSPTSLVGDGEPQNFTSLPSCQLTITASSDLSNVRYSFNSEETPSPSTSITTCAERACPAFSPAYYEQVSQLFAYAVVGGAAPFVQAPLLSATVLGEPTSYTLTGSPVILWLDFGSSWSLTNPLSGSSGAERWYASSATAPEAVVGGQQTTTTYQHQYSILIEPSPSDCGNATPSGQTWENAGEMFQVNGSAIPGCAFSAWQVAGLITVAQAGQLSTSAFADSNGTLIATFSRNIIPGPSSTISVLLVLGVCAVAAVGAALFLRNRHVRPRIPPK